MATPRRPRLGLCCTFAHAPIKFRATTARYVSTLPARERRRFLGALCLDNGSALEQAVAYCARQGIGAFRVTSQLFPLYTHPQVGYAWTDLPGSATIGR